MSTFNKISLEMLDIINNKGFEAYLVGGCVRDHLLNREINDYDITTNALPDDIVNIFSNYKVIKTGIKHGTVTVIYKSISFEITTFRTESNYLDNRHPDSVKFITSLKEDLARRDFTVNALAYNNKIYDYFDGITDLNNKIIRTVGDANKRFNEDALRILRAIRFKSKLGFTIEEATDKAIHKNRELIRNISIERIILELNQIFYYNSLIMFTDYYDLLEIIFEGLDESDKEELIKEVENIKNNELFVYAKIFSYINNYNNIRKYHFSNNFIKKIKLLNQKDLIVDKTIIGIKKILKNNSFNDMILYVKYNYDEVNEQNKLIDLFTKANKMCHNLKMLRIKGTDLINLGITDGKTIKETLDHLLTLVIEEKLENNVLCLKEYIISHKN